VLHALSERDRRDGIARPGAVRDDVLDAVQAIRAAGQAFVEQNLRVRRLDLGVGKRRVDTRSVSSAFATAAFSLPLRAI
jgi:hypothetical protein